METPTRARRIRFGPFEVDPCSGDLRKSGVRIKLQDQPFQVLALLLQRPGEVISRREFHEKLWPADTFVDFDTGLNSAVKKLRDTLGDSSEKPRYIETVPRRGYRLIVPVESLEDQPSAQAADPKFVAGRSEATEFSIETNGAEKAQEVSLPAAEKGLATPARKSLLRWHTYAIAAALLALLAVASWRILRERSGGYSIAVLPFKNLSADPNSDYFSDGLTDEIINNLSVIEGLQVKSRTSSFYFKDKASDIHEVGDRLGAKLVLEGSVLRAGKRLRINAQLVRVSDDVPIWSNSFDRELKDVFAIQDEISRSIVNELRLKLGQGQRRYNTNLEAYDLYLKAQSLTADPLLPEGRGRLLEGIDVYQQVIANDAAFAPAYAGIATAYGRLSITPRSYSPEEAQEKIRGAAEKALQLDPLLAEAHASMGLLYSRENNWQESEKAFRRSMEIDPNLSASRKDFAMWVLFPLGRLDEATRELRKAVELDPLSAEPRDTLDYVLLSAGHYDEVLENCRHVLLGTPNDNIAEQLFARALLLKGRLNEATAIFEKQDRAGTGSPGFLGYAYALAGRREEAEKVAARYPEWPWVHVFVYAGLGDKSRTFEALEKMAEMHDPRVGPYLRYPELASIRGDKRTMAIREKLGMPGAD